MGMENVAGKLPYEFSCPCGQRIHVDPMTKERRMLCPGCRNPIDFTVDFNLNQRSIQVSVIIPRDPGKQGGASPEGGPGAKSAARTVREVVARCPCGTSFPVDDQQLEALQSCPGCKGNYHVVLKTESGSQTRVAILVPQKPIVHRGEIIRATIFRKAPAPDQPPEAPPTLQSTFGRRSRTRVTVPKAPPPPIEPARPKPAPEVPPGAQAVPCPCGASFIVRKKDIGHELPCAECGRVASFSEIRDPQTLAPIIRVKILPPP
jgi:hypothetical protein